MNIGDTKLRETQEQETSDLAPALKMAAGAVVFDVLPVCPLTNDTVTIPVKNAVWNKDIVTLGIKTGEFKVVSYNDDDAVEMLSEYVTYRILNTFVQKHIEYFTNLNNIDHFKNVISSAYLHLMNINRDNVGDINMLVSQKMYDILLSHYKDSIDTKYTKHREDLPVYYGGKLQLRYTNVRFGIYVVTENVDPDDFFQNNIMIVCRNKGVCTTEKIDDTINGFMFAPYTLIQKNEDDTYSTKYAIVELGEHPENNYMSIKIDLDNK